MDEVEALLAGRHGDPHRMLGIHEIGSRSIIRVLRPGANEVIARTKTQAIKLDPRGKGLFEAYTDDPGDRSPLQLEISYPDGTRITEYDGYGFLPTVGDLDLHLFGEGRHERLFAMLGARAYSFGDVQGTAFSVWAPTAAAVSLVGDFNLWNPISTPMRELGSSGVWELFMPSVGPGARYKFAILEQNGSRHLRADPLALAAEVPPRTASVVWSSHYAWQDQDWISRREQDHPWTKPISIYEVHLGSWRRGLNYVELAQELGEYVNELGFTHVELMPVMEHPFSGSWGYQVTGFYAPTSRFGSPDEFKHFVDEMHKRGIGVILDWVPAHFPRDEWALARFDGSALYEHDSQRGAHPDWGTLIFNHGRNEVRNFLISSARNWLEEYHCDGLRVDAVASMLYLDYSREPGQWSPNNFGGREDLEALAFLRDLNTAVHRDFPGTIMMAEESTSWPGVSRPVSVGGLGFGFKWNMGWMHDTLEYFHHEPIHRRYHHDELTFSSMYAFSENFVLPLSHDEVVHGKGSLLTKMPGDPWQQFANLRALYGYMWAHPGKKLLFMGGELAQQREWHHERSLDWDLLANPANTGLSNLVRDLNRIYQQEPALWELDSEMDGFRWIDAGDALHNVISFVRNAKEPGHCLVAICNLSPVPRHRYRLGMPESGRWFEILNTDSSFYGGSDVGNGGSVMTTRQSSHGQADSAVLELPPLATIWLVPEVHSQLS